MKFLGLSLIAILLYSCGQKEMNYEGIPSSGEDNYEEISLQDSLDIKNIITIQTKSGNFEEREKIWSEDGRWLQAFGRVFHGKDTIINFIKFLHANPGYAQSIAKNYSDPEIKFLRPDVVVVHQYHEREGQVINEVVTPTRRVNTTYIITKENGVWLLRDKVTMDERERPNI
ncbi:nuclear transport factor 2 family protein [Algoriphagus halophilus]|uniref:DUF4440 domain-containing protein n=1 Tax=Algoriphagus halophilus TaxID=226505 RepID=A0A1N6G417_9BACT|nr:nuclear transport factor 2 family protein [Algoriphagus halophilus]SIO02191.1 protein of unknown function [Algoriphagus halophilus]